MSKSPVTHKNYDFNDATVVIKAKSSTDGFVFFKVHRDRIATSSATLGAIISVKLGHWAVDFPTDESKIIEFPESSVVWQAILGFIYNHPIDSNLQSIPIADLLAIWKASHSFGLHALLNASEAVIVGKTLEGNCHQILQMYLDAKRMGRAIVKRKSWIAVKEQEFRSFDDEQLSLLSVQEVVQLAKHSFKRKIQEDGNKRLAEAIAASKKRKV